MPRKGMSIPSLQKTTTPPSYTTPTFSDTTVSEIIETAAVTIMKWKLEASTSIRLTSLFRESKSEAYRFVTTVSDLQKVMTFLVSGFSGESSGKLAQSQILMQIAMKTLENELYQILSANRAHLDPESVSGSSRVSTTSSSDLHGGDDDARSVAVEEVSATVTSDLKLIAECMFSCGYRRECVRLYEITRKSIIDEGIYRLGIEKMSSAKFNRIGWEAIDLKITKWLIAVKVATRSIFAGERILCDRVFGFSDTIGESCFSEIAGNGAEILFGFPELVSKSKRSSPEKIFRVLDMYVAISDQWPEIESIFSSNSSSTIRSRALSSMLRLGESVRVSVSEYETSIKKDLHKSPLPPAAGVHDLTLHLMSFLTLLADYSHVISDIFSDSQESNSVDPESPSPASLRISSLILVLACKLDLKAKHYKYVSQSYLFLANNLSHVVYRTRTSNLQFLLGEQWIEEHEAKARQFAGSYERFMWGPVLSSLPEDPTAVNHSPTEAFRRFNASFEDTCRKQSSWVVPDPKLRDEITGSIGRRLVPGYRGLYENHRVQVDGLIVKYTPEDLEDALSDLFLGRTVTDLSRSARQQNLWT